MVVAELLLVIAVLVVLLGLALQWRESNRTVSEIAYTKKPHLFTPREQTFLRVLEAVVGERYRIFGQVRVADVLNPTRNASHQSALNKVTRKSFDFLLCDPQTLEVLLAIELNDASHEHPHRKQRDVFLAAACASAGLPLLEQPVLVSYDAAELESRIASAIQSPSSGVILASPISQDKNSPFDNRSLIKIAVPVIGLIFVGVIAYSAMHAARNPVEPSKQINVRQQQREKNVAAQQAASQEAVQARQQQLKQQATAATRELAKREMEIQQAEQEKERAWLSYYKRSPKCENPADWSINVACGNEYMAAKREFDARWKESH